MLVLFFVNKNSGEAVEEERYFKTFRLLLVEGFSEQWLLNHCQNLIQVNLSVNKYYVIIIMCFICYVIKYKNMGYSTVMNVNLWKIDVIF